MGTEINQLSAVDSLQAGDQLAVYDTSNGDARKSSLTTLLTWIEGNITLTNAGQPNTQYAQPSATAFSVPITDGSDSIHLILTPTGTFATGTIVLPAVANAVDKQEVIVNSTQIITTLTVDGNGAVAVTGEPTTMAANDFFTLKYDALTKTWYRVA